MNFSKLADRAAPLATSFAFSDRPARWRHSEFFLLFKSALESFANTGSSSSQLFSSGLQANQ